MYLEGKGVSADDQQAVTFIRKAAEQGFAPAEYGLGGLYEIGKGVPQDNKEALAWYAKAAAQGYKDAKDRLDKLEAAQNVKRDPNDVVAQVLNYTVFGNDEGFDDNFWYNDLGKCHYRLHFSDKPATDINRSTNGLEKFNKMMGQIPLASARMQRQSIDLNELDPKDITFGSNSNYGTVVQYDTEMLFFYVGGLNLDRLQRGWNLIYSKYCSGKEKPF